ncbi:MAG: dihydroneopterin aldolase [Clostridia bacterium]|nr:dihydroneopterin aldolase [Clostridia bacterium]
MDKIVIRGLRIRANHGVNEEEKRDGQTFELDVTAFLDAGSARRTDDLADTVSYADMVHKATEIFTARSYNLIEAAGDDVAEGLLDAFPRLEAVTVLVKKPEAPIRDADFDYVGVEVTMTREDVNTRKQRF